MLALNFTWRQNGSLLCVSTFAFPFYPWSFCIWRWYPLPFDFWSLPPPSDIRSLASKDHRLLVAFAGLYNNHLLKVQAQAWYPLPFDVEVLHYRLESSFLLPRTTVVSLLPMDSPTTIVWKCKHRSEVWGFFNCRASLRCYHEDDILHPCSLMLYFFSPPHVSINVQ